MTKRKVNYQLVAITGLFNLLATATYTNDVERIVIAGIGSAVGMALGCLIFGDPLADDESPKP